MTAMKQNGFTVLELIVVVAILSTLLSFAIPSFKGQIGKSQLKGAAELFYSNLQLAKSEAIMRNKAMNVSIRTGANWCMGMSDANVCDCSVTNISASNACKVDGVFRVQDRSDFPDILMASKYSNQTQDITFSFDNVRGITGKAGTTTFTTAGKEHYVSVKLSTLGRITLCSDPNRQNPKGLWGYPTNSCNVIE